jgi:hypothetical protein
LRRGDRPVTFLVKLQFEEERLGPTGGGPAPRGPSRTRIHVRIAITQGRDRRRGKMVERARTVLLSFRSYLMASEEDEAPPGGVLRKAKQILLPWLVKK